MFTDTYIWKIPETNGAIVKGGYGHSSVYDPDTGLIYIHGGYHSGSATSYYLADSLYSYDIKSKRWWVTHCLLSLSCWSVLLLSADVLVINFHLLIPSIVFLLSDSPLSKYSVPFHFFLFCLILSAALLFHLLLFLSALSAAHLTCYENFSSLILE